jgi:hypothetical protein
MPQTLVELQQLFKYYRQKTLFTTFIHLYFDSIPLLHTTYAQVNQCGRENQRHQEAPGDDSKGLYPCSQQKAVSKHPIERLVGKSMGIKP